MACKKGKIVWSEKRYVIWHLEKSLNLRYDANQRRVDNDKKSHLCHIYYWIGNVVLLVNHYVGM